MSSESIELSATPDRTASVLDVLTRKPEGEAALLAAIQSAITRPASLKVARSLSYFGEHSIGWLALSAAGALLAMRCGDKTAKLRYIEAGVGTLSAHTLSVIVKRIVRRPRPNHPDISVGVKTPSNLSFPSSHATSTTAASLLLGHAAGFKPATIPALVVPPMLVSRLVLGVHYPSDVLAGAVIGAASAGVVIVSDKLMRGTALAKKLFSYRKPVV